MNVTSTLRYKFHRIQWSDVLCHDLSWAAMFRHWSQNNSHQLFSFITDLKFKPFPSNHAYIHVIVQAAEQLYNEYAD